MKRYLVLLLALSACATPVTTLSNKQGETVTCGGSSWASYVGGLTGYSYQRHADDECVDDYKTKGYHPTNITNN